MASSAHRFRAAGAIDFAARDRVRETVCARLNVIKELRPPLSGPAARAAHHAEELLAHGHEAVARRSS